MTLFDLDETIAAPASPPGASLRGMLRISGPDVRRQLLSVFQPDDLDHWKSATRPMLHQGRISLADDLSCPVTVGLWPTSRSYTGQPMAEIYTLGSQPLLERLLSVLNEQGIRTAQKGEFTLRAFLNGRIDLVQAEAVLGVIDSESERELQTALDQLGGGLSHRMAEIRVDLLELLADLEAGLDFVEEDIEFVPHENVLQRLRTALTALMQLRELSQQRLRSETRRKVVLAGLPNAGKSTLLNRLADQEVALVSEISGTTRDYLAVECQLGGQPVLLVDTAGWELNDDPIMKSAQSFREEQIRQADLVVWCTPHALSESERQTDTEQASYCREQSRQFLHLGTKSDLESPETILPNVDLSISTLEKQDESLHRLLNRMTTLLDDESAEEGGMIGTTSARCRETIRDAEAALHRALEAAETSEGDEFIALELRAALEGLGQVLGVIHTDDLLDRIFSKFCIGK
ncbi:MAG: 50S ribosome-binding GTPase [Planctomycetaceae bacterium]|nr:50S ribosome-binding GTPase [Planctomycetaceae bacterium]